MNTAVYNKSLIIKTGSRLDWSLLVREKEIRTQNILQNIWPRLYKEVTF